MGVINGGWSGELRVLGDGGSVPLRRCHGPVSSAASAGQGVEEKWVAGRTR